ncbi:GAF domain-containing protein [Streptomyces sp. NPDC089922]|uniref:helix-turn-helix domain-containing protein n=1 Tax=Streptomyces sp. NPDC089922 TaxID=3155189 RepID=UPI00342D609A
MTTVNDSPDPAGDAALSAARSVARLLELLAEDAAAERFAEPAAQARALGLPAADQDVVDRATRTALDVRRTLEQRRRRETELAALFDTAGDLAALRDLDSVLRAIVHRARLLLGADVAYLTLADPAAGDTFMRVTDGSVSARFQQLRLGMGEGLGGLVAQSGRPYWTADYTVDGQFAHTSAIDAGVGEEGLRGILGVPLRLGTRLIGVLYAADRTVREFTPDSIALLSSLADHAATAIDSARRMEETRSALLELNAATETARGHSEALRRAAETHDRLTDLVLRGGEVGDVAREIAAILGGGLVVHDSDGAELARVAAPALAPPARGVAASRAEGRAVPVEGVWVCAVMAGSALLGSIALTGRPDLPDTDRRLFERTSLVAALLLLLRRSVAEAEERVRGELLDDLLAEDQADRPRHLGSLVLRARRLDVHLRDPHDVLVAHCEPAQRQRLQGEAARRARELRGLAGVYRGHVVLLAPAGGRGADPRELALDLGRFLRAPVTVGAAGPARGPDELPRTYADALRCLEALRSLGRVGDGAHLPELGFVGMLLGDRTDVGGYVERVLGPVLEYDAERGTELIRTLGAYYAANGSLSRAKDGLHVHVNTVVQRLERVARLLGDDWNTPERALENQLALRLHRLTRADRPSP